MRRYDKYKESGISWIGEIPEHWEVRKIKQAASCNDETLSESTPLEQVIRYVEISDVNAVEGVVNVTEYTFGKSPSRARRITRMNDVIVSTVRTYLRAVARVTEPNLIVSTGFAVLRARHINNLFLSFLLQSSGFIDEVISNSTGLNYPAITANKLTALSIPFPPLSEQEAIVAYLEEKVAKMDYLVAKQETQIGYLRELKQAIIAKAVTQGINPQAPLRPSGIPWIGNIPKHWEVRMLSQLSQEYFVSNKDIKHQNLLSLSYGRIIQRDIDTTEGLLPASYDTYQVIRRENIVLRLTDLQNDHKSLRVGLSTQEGIITSAYLTLASRSNVNPKFLYFSLHTADIKKVFYGMGSGLRQNLNWKELRKLCLPLPPPSEQEAIVTYINRKTEEIDHLIAMTEREIARVCELKQTLIADVVTGRINVQPS